jgi:hypothetical protein
MMPPIVRDPNPRVPMPNWLTFILVLIAVVPGAVVVLMGVLAMFLMPPVDPEREPAGFEVIKPATADPGERPPPE